MEGIKYDEDKLLWSLIPWGPMHEVVKVLTDGAKKYTPDNWKKVDVQRYREAMLRHTLTYQGGEITDPESGSHHLAHAVANALIIMWHESKEENTEKYVFDNPIEGPTRYYKTSYEQVTKEQFEDKEFMGENKMFTESGYDQLKEDIDPLDYGLTSYSEQVKEFNEAVNEIVEVEPGQIIKYTESPDELFSPEWAMKMIKEKKPL